MRPLCLWNQHGWLHVWRERYNASHDVEAECVMDSLTAHAKYIDVKLDLIPAQFYFRVEGDENQWKCTKYTQNVRGKAPKQTHKSESKRGLKLAKFKEENIKSIHQQQKVCMHALLYRLHEDRRNCKNPIAYFTGTKRRCDAHFGQYRQGRHNSRSERQTPDATSRG